MFAGYPAFTEPYRLNFKTTLTAEINPLQTDFRQNYMQDFGFCITHYTENRLVLFGEKRRVNCEIRRKCSKFVCGQNTELGCFVLQQEAHIVPATEGLEHETINKLVKSFCHYRVRRYRVTEQTFPFKMVDYLWFSQRNDRLHTLYTTFGAKIIALRDCSVSFKAFYTLNAKLKEAQKWDI